MIWLFELNPQESDKKQRLAEAMESRHPEPVICHVGNLSSFIVIGQICKDRLTWPCGKRHRRYVVKDLVWIEFLTRLRAAGMPIHYVEEFATLRRRGDSATAVRCTFLEAHQQMTQRTLRNSNKTSKPSSLSLKKKKGEENKLMLHQDGVRT
ncbi:MAG: hypothetical protein J2P37_07565 [Ktedonobacteraceae bacterium]|nr:hypothetical protein [Ktedonobacteraceae bacterium]